MSARILNRDELLRLIDEAARDRRLIGPVRRGERTFYEAADRAAELDLDGPQCVYSPKAHFFPPEETLLTFERKSRSFVTHPVRHETPTALVAVRPCEIHGIRLLDHVFGAAPADEGYLARRRATFIIALDCFRPCRDEAFCGDLGTNTAHLGFDLMIRRLSDPEEGSRGAERFELTSATEDGASLLSRAGLGRTADRADLDAVRAYERSKASAFPRRLSCEADRLPEVAQRGYTSTVWERTAARCYSCGSCNLVCPTCYCFNLRDEVSLDGKSGARVREWDGCQLREFAVVAGGHNFRAAPAERLRHRVMRKASWIAQRTGLPGCVGCGRCDRACTAKISLVEILNTLAREQDHDHAGHS
ncbi:MAG: 4Fe-4S dicluster domain-containing protein [Phycisphaerae bacterium]|nr:MAG: hypothetical protein EDS66_05065 [Planctomycetota bacterium]MBE7456317.1 4Fe-4S dicluster domain-containing protein [Planctomycetia bacterium]MCK6465647.1 4Fe-4S dicluster domain-containing protein [Phycisphaerae bacterium]MCL4718436.1 4Fe-4S dicluster domain-containing protein [Phycisphaerae bacterium]MCQ3921168.1 hypothetical protein [Planctomycetota bacterium]